MTTPTGQSQPFVMHMPHTRHFFPGRGGLSTFTSTLRSRRASFSCTGHNLAWSEHGAGTRMSDLTSHQYPSYHVPCMACIRCTVKRLSEHCRADALVCPQSVHYITCAATVPAGCVHVFNRYLLHCDIHTCTSGRSFTSTLCSSSGDRSKSS